MSLIHEAFSFSTCWNIKKHHKGREIIEEIKELGFRQVELNYNVTKEMMESITPMIEQGEISVSSVHNVFPYISDKEYDTDSVMLGFENKEKRQRAVDLLIGSIEHAVQLGAEGVVVHPGEVPFPHNIDAELKKLYKDKGTKSEEYLRLWAKMMEQRESNKTGYLERIQQSLEEVSNYIHKKQYKIGIGIETRSRCYQIPTLNEANTIIANLSGAPVYLWYDIGHAIMMERMGLYDSTENIEEMKKNILGVHIHETIGLSDHWCPYVNSGDEKFFDRYIEIIEAAPLKVYELKSKCMPEEIKKSHKLIESKMKNGV